MKSLSIYEFLWIRGGGQRVACNVAEALSKCGKYDVSVVLDKPIPQKWFEHTFSADFSNVTLTTERKPCDVFLNSEFAYYKIDPTFGKKRIIYAHDAHPLGAQPNYLPEYHALMVNSGFSKHVFESADWPFKPNVVYPPVFRDTRSPIKPEDRWNVILVVGRFDHRRRMNSFPVAIDIFKRAVDRGLSGYELVFAGTVMESPVYQQLVEEAYGYPIRFETNPSDYQLRQLYSNSRFLLNVRGIDSPMPPVFTSHEALGLVTIEAIELGCIPIVYDFGGHTEVVPHSELWGRTEDELAERLLHLCGDYENQYENHIPKLREHISALFSFKQFTERFIELEEGLHG